MLSILSRWHQVDGNGADKRGGIGCYCSEGALLQALLTPILVRRDEVFVLDKEQLAANLVGFNLLGFIPYDRTVVEAEMANLPVLDASPLINREASNIYQSLLSTDDNENNKRQQ